MGIIIWNIMVLYSLRKISIVLFVASETDNKLKF